MMLVNCEQYHKCTTLAVKRLLACSSVLLDAQDYRNFSQTRSD
jgi:hypothetical protein